MSKTTAPLLSFEASGQVAQTVVYAQWRGVKYARRHVIPSNPRTMSQQRSRSIFGTLREMWKLLPTEGRAPWTAFAQGRRFTDMNAFVGEQRRAIGGASDLTSFIGSPGARGGLPAGGVTVTTGTASGEIDVDFVAPEVPTGWTLVGYEAIAFPDQDPEATFAGPYSVGTVATPTTTITLTGLTADTLCVAAGWTEWTKPDGRTAYGPSLVGTATSQS